MKNIKVVLLALSYILTCTMSACANNCKIKPEMLTCEYMVNPTTVDALSPRMSWVNETVGDNVRGESQVAYRICVASSEENLLHGIADVWDSGKRRSPKSFLIAYEGKELQSGADYWWRVMVWDSNDVASQWSKPARWGMGLLKVGEWKAKWIGAPWQGETARKDNVPAAVSGRDDSERFGKDVFPAPLFRKSFRLKDANVRSAKVFVTGLGYFEFYINGKKVGDDCLVPNFTNYSLREGIKYTGIAINNRFRDYRVMYLAYDITTLLKKRDNVAGAIVGDGFYDCTSRWVDAFGSLRFLCQIEVIYRDGTKDIICSDDTWKVKESPVVMNGVYDGEIYDANRETNGWATTGCDDATWRNAVIRLAPTGKLTAHTSPADKVMETFHPRSFSKNVNGEYEVDFGEEISGWIHFKDITGHKGDTLNVKYICESPLGVQKYIFKDDGKISYAPRFTWYVFRKAIISGIDRLKPEMLTAEAVNSDVSISAEFKTSNTLFDKINKIWQRSQSDNMHGGVASDCPHRERSPYTGDGQVACVTVMHNFDAAAFYNKWIRDIRDVQDIETGYVPNGAPWQPGCGGGVAWGAAMNIMPWEFYLHYGDVKMLEDSYQAMKEQTDYMLSWLTADSTMLARRTNYNSAQFQYWLNLGDWAPAFELPSDELVHTFYLRRCADMTARAAKVLGRNDDFDKYGAIAENVKSAFNRKFYDDKNKTYGDFGGNVFALVTGVPPERYDAVVKTLNSEISEKYKGHLNTGIFGTQFLFETLAANGMNNLAYDVMDKRDFPSYGHWIEQGATTTWEQWNGKDSRNHPMFGGALTWFYRTLAGVNVDENEPGYKHIILKPSLPDKLNDVYYSNITPYGKVVSEIKRNDATLKMNVTVPVGSHATIYLPVGAKSAVTENGKPLETVSDIKIAGLENGYLIVKTGQGRFRFVIEN